MYPDSLKSLALATNRGLGTTLFGNSLKMIRTHTFLTFFIFVPVTLLLAFTTYQPLKAIIIGKIVFEIMSMIY